MPPIRRRKFVRLPRQSGNPPERQFGSGWYVSPLSEPASCPGSTPLDWREIVSYWNAYGYPINYPGTVTSHYCKWEIYVCPGMDTGTGTYPLDLREMIRYWNAHGYPINYPGNYTFHGDWQIYRSPDMYTGTGTSYGNWETYAYSDMYRETGTSYGSYDPRFRYDSQMENLQPIQYFNINNRPQYDSRMENLQPIQYFNINNRPQYNSRMENLQPIQYCNINNRPQMEYPPPSQNFNINNRPQGQGPRMSTTGGSYTHLENFQYGNYSGAASTQVNQQTSIVQDWSPTDDGLFQGGMDLRIENKRNMDYYF